MTSLIPLLVEVELTSSFPFFLAHHEEKTEIIEITKHCMREKKILLQDLLNEVHHCIRIVHLEQLFDLALPTGTTEYRLK